VTAPVTTGWHSIDVVTEGTAIDVRGTNPWNHMWTPEGTQIQVAHPSYPEQRHLLDVYRIDVGKRTTIFAAGELSANVWLFLAPDDEFVQDEL
jgi:hypothetical protein